MIQIKRIYDNSERSDGMRILVDRIWPRGVSKEKANLDDWVKEVAPSTKLRKWFDHDPTKWEEFKKKYQAELEENKDAVDRLRVLSKKRKNTTLLYAAKDEKHNQAIVLKDFLSQ